MKSNSNYIRNRNFHPEIHQILKEISESWFGGYDLIKKVHCYILHPRFPAKQTPHG
ncbi:hypothetical protein [Pollutibacter soli]|uniref:hypothetical protein n=1 Tax=Pollutibacter soli TaxID=3034157 RepID=UPI0030135AA3